VKLKMKLALQAALMATGWSLCCHVAVARQAFVTLIPNANGPLGHAGGVTGGPLNAFGEAFQAANLQWTPALCQHDSDGDGATNGEELGDPCCQWTPGSALPLTTAAVTHPGEAGVFTEAQLASMRCAEAQEVPTDAWTPLEPAVDSAGSMDMDASGSGSGDVSWPDAGAAIRPRGLTPSKAPAIADPPAKSSAARRFLSASEVLTVWLAGAVALA
jgi:hypothetical protein